MGRLLVVAALLVLQGCRYGTPVEDFSPAREPDGVTMRIDADVRSLSGELIEVRAEGIVLRVGGQVWLLEYSDIASASFEQVRGSFGLGSHRTPDPKARSRMTLLARFPQGLSPESTYAFLAVYGQTRYRRLGDP